MNKFLRFSLLLALMLLTTVSNAKTVYVYKKATTIESGKSYLIAAKVDDKLKVAKLDTRKYGYLSVFDATESDGTIELEDADNVFLFTATDGGFTIQMSNNKYLYQKGTYDSFNFDAAPTEGQVWSVSNSEGFFKITNVSVSKYIQYSPTHSSYGSYAEAQEGAVLPFLYLLDGTKEVADDDPNAKGEKANPYTVTEIQAIGEGAYPSGKVWVKGYIAGCVNTSMGSELSSGNPVASNIGLSATANVETVIPIQLPTGAVRAALNLVDNTNNLGKEVLIEGEVAKYCGVTGIKSSSAYEFTGNSVTIITGVAAVKADVDKNAPAYNMAGQRVSNSFKGLIIKGGKKLINK